MEGTAFIIQGPTTYCKEVVENYSGSGLVIWVTWLSEPIENINIITSSAIQLLQIERPETTGYWNINLQCATTTAGLVFIKKNYPNVKFAMKIRSDMIIANFKRFYASNARLIASERNELIFLGYVKSPKENYLLDYIVGGQVDAMLRFWKTSDDENFGLPFPEADLQQRYFDYNPVLSNRLPAFFNINNTEIFWLKPGINLKKYTEVIYLNVKFAAGWRLILKMKRRINFYLKRYKK
ncbi:hypothetical protein DU508_22400 [Pedobacter chinensis]|uniref:Uncharacterized protein n=1 Tax=Pedobacter chinensis TaxID=2282421 RepID=A0A369PNR1_9SPHI|nr:hypothetical protein [Pedobacter chinensis]RDC54241.1 hypothetical protein DU508_22400 [Pedobacter chinensis]